MHFTSEQRLDDGVVERDFTLGEIPGILWTPGSASAPVPLILLGHPGGLRTMHPRLVARARRSAADGFAAATIELPGSGDRPRPAAAEQARADLRRALEAGEPVTTRSSTGSSSRWSSRRSRNGRPPSTPSSRCPRSAARSVLGRGDRHRCPAGGGRAAHRGRGPVRGELRAPRHPRGGPPGHHSAACPAAVGRRRERPADGPGPVRRVRLPGEDAAREHGRAHRRPAVRGG